MAGGFVPDAKQLNATTQPPTKAEISYRREPQGPPESDSKGHVPMASIAHSQPVRAEAVTRALVINKARPGIAWGAPKLADVVFQHRGYPLGPTQLQTLVNPKTWRWCSTHRQGIGCPSAPTR